MLDANITQDNQENLSLQQEFVTLCDKYSEFNDYTAFFCKSASLLIAYSETEINQQCAQGASRFAQALMDTSQNIDQSLQEILKKL